MAQLRVLVFILILSVALADELYVHSRHRKPKAVRHFPKNSVFIKKDLMDKGCTTFLNDCPKFYKYFMACARHYDGNYKTFNSYCELEYENCNGWRQWSLIKNGRC